MVLEILLKRRNLLLGIANQPIRQSNGRRNALPKLSNAATLKTIFPPFRSVTFKFNTILAVFDYPLEMVKQDEDCF